MKVYGITGGIASGKSSVTGILQEMGYTVIDMDLVSREVVVAGSEGLAKVVETFGAEYLSPDSTLDRKKLAGRVFGSKAELDRLNGVMRPFMEARMLEHIRSHADEEFVFVDAALIIEWKWHEKFDGTVLVTAPIHHRIERAMARDGATVEQVQGRIDSQMTDREKLPFVEYEIENTGTMHGLHTRVVTMIDTLKEMHSEFDDQDDDGNWEPRDA